jgi:hypothetical protein
MEAFIHLLIVLAVIGIALWLFNALVTLDPKIKQVINALVLIAVFIIVVTFVLCYFHIYCFHGG